MRLLALACSFTLAELHALSAQHIARDRYYVLLPPVPKIVSQTRASAALHLFGDVGDSSYRDAQPVDGIDDRRAQRLLILAERFSPILRRNNFSVPRDFRQILGPNVPLEVDSWRNGQLERSDSVSIFGGGPIDSARAIQAGRTQSGTAGEPLTDARAAANDRQLLDLVRLTSPRVTHGGTDPAEGELERVLFVDLPGDGPSTWRRIYSRLDPKRGSHIFVHPFIYESPAPDADRRFQLVFQYWFFYPFNDAVNTHEGDWEHINVLVTTRAAALTASPRSAAHALLDSATLAAILAPSSTADDSLIIAAVDHYFHESVLTLDYLALTDTLAAEAPPVNADHPHYMWEDLEFARRIVRRRLAVAGGRLATHPLVFVGGNNKGPDEILALRPTFRGSYKRNSDASYPFPGVWEGVGPLGATEKVYGAAVPELRGDSTLPWYRLIDDEYSLTYRTSDMTLVPDWERVESLVLEQPSARSEWSWLLLPIRWGYPAMESLGAGMVKHADLGNIALLTPTYHPTWNRIGPSRRHGEYRLRVLRTPVSPTSPWSALQSGWGVFNAPLAAWGLMPGYNVALLQLMPWVAGTMNFLGAPPARTYTSGRLPRRFTNAGQGVFVDFGGRDFAATLPRADAPTSSDPRGTVAMKRAPRVGSRLWFDLSLTERLALENTFAWSASAVSYQLSDVAAAGPPTVRGRLSMRQLTGGLRYTVQSVSDQAVQLYFRAGYGWLSYHTDQMQADSVALAASTVRGGYLPPILPSHHWWPNTWYGGAGIEAFSPPRYWLLHRLGYGVRIEFSEFLNRLHFDESSGHGDVTARRGDLALAVIFGW